MDSDGVATKWIRQWSKECRGLEAEYKYVGWNVEFECEL